MRRESTIVWEPPTSGLTFTELQGVRAPASSLVTRLLQMNAIARRFRADFSPHTKPNEFTRLRLLSKALFRYDSENSSVVDGAVYGFVDATDPELLLVIEARRTENGTTWVYAPTRSRHDHLRLYLSDELVWEAPRLAPPWENIRDPKKSYFNQRLDKSADASIRKEVMEVFNAN